MVVHDELDLPFGTVRLKLGGGDNGHNGLRSVTAPLGTRDYYRVRFGIGRPPGRMDPAAFVLGTSPPPSGRNSRSCSTAADAVEALLAEGLAAAQNAFHADSADPPLSAYRRRSGAAPLSVTRFSTSPRPKTPLAATGAKSRPTAMSGGQTGGRTLRFGWGRTAAKHGWKAGPGGWGRDDTAAVFGCHRGCRQRITRSKGDRVWLSDDDRLAASSRSRPEGYSSGCVPEGGARTSAGRPATGIPTNCLPRGWRSAVRVTRCCPRRGSTTRPACPPTGSGSWTRWTAPASLVSRGGPTGRSTSRSGSAAAKPRAQLTAGAVALPAQGRVLSTSTAVPTAAGTRNYGLS